MLDLDLEVCEEHAIVVSETEPLLETDTHPFPAPIDGAIKRSPPGDLDFPPEV